MAPTVSDVEGENPAAIEVIEAADPRAEVEAAARGDRPGCAGGRCALWRDRRDHPRARALS